MEQFRSYPLEFKKLSKTDADEEQAFFYYEIKRAKHGRIADEKRNFLKSLRIVFNGR